MVIHRNGRRFRDRPSSSIPFIHGYTTTDQSNPCGRDAYALELHGILIPVDGFSALRAMALFMLNMICACCRLFRRWNSLFQLGISLAPRVESRCYSSCFSRHTSGERRPPFRYDRPSSNTTSSLSHPEVRLRYPFKFFLSMS